jgi:HEPN domain-containing protein
MARRHLDWMAQAERDYKHAKNAVEDGDFEWCCFACQQAAEKALKALIESRNGRATGHSITTLLRLLKIEDEFLLESALRLDRHYIPTRYPNSYDSGSPGEYYLLNDANQALEDAKKIMDYCKIHLRK